MDTIALQNDRLLVQALPEQGALALTDKQTGVTFRQANSGMQFLRLSCTFCRNLSSYSSVFYPCKYLKNRASSHII